MDPGLKMEVTWQVTDAGVAKRVLSYAGGWNFLAPLPRTHTLFWKNKIIYFVSEVHLKCAERCIKLNIFGNV